MSKISDGDSLRLVFQLPAPAAAEENLLPYLVPKGYVTIDGASLTLTSVDDAARTFSVMLIKHTQDSITLGHKNIGARANIEVDMVGKYVQKSVRAALVGGGDQEMRGYIEQVVLDVLKIKGL